MAPEAIYSFVQAHIGPRVPGEALFIACTNYRAMSALSLLKVTYDVPIVTSNLAALQAVDKELYEAARVDGAGPWHQFLHVTEKLQLRTELLFNEIFADIDPLLQDRNQRLNLGDGGLRGRALSLFLGGLPLDGGDLGALLGDLRRQKSLGGGNLRGRGAVRRHEFAGRVVAAGKRRA